MGFSTSPAFPCEIETEIFPALLTEFKEVFVESRSADLTVMDLHTFQVIGYRS